MILDNNNLDETIKKVLDLYIDNIEKSFQDDGISADIISYTGDIHDSFLIRFREFIELVKFKRETQKDILIIILGTPGGTATAVEKMVDIIRYHYKEVYFVVPDAAMSAGTIFCMSGDKIFMDYASSLGPIDPQIPNEDGTRLVPALGYIDKVEELIQKSLNQALSDVEFARFQRLDLGTIRAHEQARDLSIDLLKKWLVTYKFKNWHTHQTTNPGTPVTLADKENRAEEIATILSDNKRWHDHGRYISIETLQNELKLEIEDYSANHKLRYSIIEYNNLIKEFVAKNNRRVFLHTNLTPDEEE